MPEVRYRAAEFDDAPLAADVMNAAYPGLTHDPVMTRYRWEHPRAGYAQGRFLAERESSPIAYLGWIHGPWERLPDRHCEVEVWLDRAHLDRELLVEMWSWIEGEAMREGSRLLLAYAAEDEPEMLDALATLGYEKARAEKVWGLDLVAHGPRLLEEAAQARNRTRADGIALTTFAEWTDPTKMQKLYELNEVTVQDVPHTLPIVSETFEDFEHRVRAPDRREDRIWIALDGERAIAMSYLKFPPVRGTVWTGFTCTHPDYRGRGIARAVKLQSLAQATELGIPVVCTDNDSENAPMLHINERLGYERRPGFVEHHKRVEETNRGPGN